jgi:hypothetical protein
MAKNQPNADQACVSALSTQRRCRASFLVDKNPKHADGVATLQTIGPRRPTRYNPGSGKTASFAQGTISV